MLNEMQFTPEIDVQRINIIRDRLDNDSFTVDSLLIADKIIALEDGRIIEVGDHLQLMRRGGLYSQLYRRQLQLATVE